MKKTHRFKNEKGQYTEAAQELFKCLIADLQGTIYATEKINQFIKEMHEEYPYVIEEYEFLTAPETLEHIGIVLSTLDRAKEDKDELERAIDVLECGILYESHLLI